VNIGHTGLRLRSSRETYNSPIRTRSLCSLKSLLTSQSSLISHSHHDNSFVLQSLRMRKIVTKFAYASFLILLCTLAPNLIQSMPILSKVRAISFDVTGTILVHRYPIMDTYAASAVWARLPNPPTSAELKPAFKKAYFKHLTESPCFGAKEGLSSRQWYGIVFATHCLHRKMMMGHS
jgi:hypothetical protein